MLVVFNVNHDYPSISHTQIPSKLLSTVASYLTHLLDRYYLTVFHRQTHSPLELLSLIIVHVKQGVFGPAHQNLLISIESEGLHFV